MIWQHEDVWAKRGASLENAYAARVDAELLERLRESLNCPREASKNNTPFQPARDLNRLENPSRASVVC